MSGRARDVVGRCDVVPGLEVSRAPVDGDRRRVIGHSQGLCAQLPVEPGGVGAVDPEVAQFGVVGDRHLEGVDGLVAGSPHRGAVGPDAPANLILARDPEIFSAEALARDGLLRHHVVGIDCVAAQDPHRLAVGPEVPDPLKRLEVPRPHAAALVRAGQVVCADVLQACNAGPGVGRPQHVAVGPDAPKLGPDDAGGTDCVEIVAGAVPPLAVRVLGVTEHLGGCGETVGMGVGHEDHAVVSGHAAQAGLAGGESRPCHDVVVSVACPGLQVEGDQPLRVAVVHHPHRRSVAPQAPRERPGQRVAQGVDVLGCLPAERPALATVDGDGVVAEVLAAGHGQPHIGGRIGGQRNLASVGDQVGVVEAPYRRPRVLGSADHRGGPSPSWRRPRCMCRGPPRGRGWWCR